MCYRLESTEKLVQSWDAGIEKLNNTVPGSFQCRKAEVIWPSETRTTKIKELHQARNVTSVLSLVLGTAFVIAFFVPVIFKYLIIFTALAVVRYAPPFVTFARLQNEFEIQKISALLTQVTPGGPSV